MNRGFTLALLTVILAAMGLVALFHGPGHRDRSLSAEQVAGGDERLTAAPTVPSVELRAGEPVRPVAAERSAAGGSRPAIEPRQPVRDRDAGNNASGQEDDLPLLSRSTLLQRATQAADQALVEAEAAIRQEARQRDELVREQEAARLRAEEQRVAREKATREKAERDRLARERAERERAEKEKTAQTAVRDEELSLKAPHTLVAIGVHFAEQRMRVRIEADSPFPYKSFVLHDPERLVIDLPGAWTGMKAPDVPKNRIIKGVRLGNQAAGPRLVLDLEGKLGAHSIHRISRNVVEIFVE